MEQVNEASLSSSDVMKICLKHHNAPDRLLDILHDLQHLYGYVPNDAFQQIADKLNLSRAEVYGVFSFYHDFSETPPAPKCVSICQSEACQAVGARILKKQLESDFKVSADATRPDDVLTIKSVYCLGNCALGPSAMIGRRVYGRVSLKLIKQLLEQSEC